MSPASMAALVFSNALSVVSPKYLRRSLCPTITCEQPNALIIGPDTSPVKAPSVAQQRFCAPTCIVVPRVALTAVDKRPKTLEERRGAGGVLVHLPVPTDHRCSHMSSLCNPGAQQSDRRLK